MKVAPSRMLAWAVPMLLTAGTLIFFLVITMPRAQPGPSSHELLITFTGIALIVLIPLGTLLYHLAADRSEREMK